jgi:hypothetical protein
VDVFAVSWFLSSKLRIVCFGIIIIIITMFSSNIYIFCFLFCFAAFMKAWLGIVCFPWIQVTGKTSPHVLCLHAFLFWILKQNSLGIVCWKENCCALSNRHFPAVDDSRCVFCCFFVLFCPVFLCIGLFCWLQTEEEALLVLFLE